MSINAPDTREPEQSGVANYRTCLLQHLSTQGLLPGLVRLWPTSRKVPANAIRADQGNIPCLGQADACGSVCLPIWRWAWRVPGYEPFLLVRAEHILLVVRSDLAYHEFLPCLRASALTLLAPHASPKGVADEPQRKLPRDRTMRQQRGRVHAPVGCNRPHFTWFRPLMPAFRQWSMAVSADE